MAAFHAGGGRRIGAVGSELPSGSDAEETSEILRRAPMPDWCAQQDPDEDEDEDQDQPARPNDERGDPSSAKASDRRCIPVRSAQAARDSSDAPRIRIGLDQLHHRRENPKRHRASAPTTVPRSERLRRGLEA